LVGVPAKATRTFRCSQRRAHQSLQRGLVISLERVFGQEAVLIAVDAGYRNDATFAAESHQAIAVSQTPGHLNRLSLLRVARVVDWHIVVLAPEERYGAETCIRPRWLETTEHTADRLRAPTLSGPYGESQADWHQ